MNKCKRRLYDIITAYLDICTMQYDEVKGTFFRVLNDIYEGEGEE